MPKISLTKVLGNMERRLPIPNARMCFVNFTARYGVKLSLLHFSSNVRLPESANGSSFLKSTGLMSSKQYTFKDQ